MAVQVAGRADYGLDAPGLVRKFLVVGLTAVVGGALIIWWTTSDLIGTLAANAAVAGAIFAVMGALMWWSSRYGKFAARDSLLDGLKLRGDEQVLDVGCGRGLLLIGAARRLSGGHATGLDLWSAEDLSDNSRAATLTNATIEGVAERVSVQDGDMRQMPFPDGSFDAIVASMAIHNIYTRDGRAAAIAEIVRVLKPGGRVALQDFRHVQQYAADLRAAGMQDVRVQWPVWGLFPFCGRVTGRKAA